MQLWRTAYDSCDHCAVIDELYSAQSGSVTKHLASVPILDSKEVRFSPEYTYNRHETLKSLL